MEEKVKVFMDSSTGRLMYKHKKVKRIFWTENMISLLKKYFPDTNNEEISGILGVSERTVSRKARELGLKKDPSYINGMLMEKRALARVRSKQLGYPGSFKKGTFSGNRYTGMVNINKYEEEKGNYT